MKKATIETLNKIKGIMESHKGKENAITSKELAQKLGIVEDDTHAKTRNLIFQCAKECLLPIAATKKGYFIIQTKDECYAYLTQLNKRSKQIQERKDIVILNFLET